MESSNPNSTIQQIISEDLDRISKLHDELLHRILILLPTKFVVQTSVLSRRWQSLWTTIPYVDFDEANFIPDREEDEAEDINDHIFKFMAFVDAFLILFQGSTIERFCVSCSSYTDPARVCTWVRAAVLKYNVKVLVLNIATGDIVILPHCLFTMQSLVALTLNLFSCELNLPTLIHLPKLEDLRLNYITFDNNSAIHHLVSNCPALEYLRMEGCQWNSNGMIDISSPKLKSLVISGSNWFGGEGEADSKIQINAPNLVWFIYFGLLAPNFSFKGSSLQKASLDMRYQVRQDLARASRILYSARTVKALDLSPWTIASLRPNQFLTVNLPIFYDLNELHLHSPFSKSQLQGITRLLRHTPNLEVLQLNVLQGRPNNKERGVLDEWFLEVELYRLKLVKIINIRVSLKPIRIRRNQFEFVRCALKYAPVLERVIVKLPPVDVETKMLLSQELLMLPKANRNCVVEII